MLTQPDVVFVDLREVRELEKEGMISGAVHSARASIEFAVDPESPYFKPVFGDASKRFVLYCAGGWRSALATATLLDMGMTNVSHVEGGFTAWKGSGAPVVAKPQEPTKS
jgi:rhodanese-related sulfurtransferase